MVLTDYYQQQGDLIRFSRQQASRFAKEVANDYNPLHDADARMFCVPGDLLFSVSLQRLGLSQQMKFTFSGMISDQTVSVPDTDASRIDITDANGKCYLTIERSGEITRDADLIKHLVTNYVAFSGKTFPHVLVPLMSEHGVMINPARPLAIYQQMEIRLDQLDLISPMLQATDSSLEVSGKKGIVRFDFELIDNGELVGYGAKHMSLRGLRPYDGAAMAQLVEEYKGHRENYPH